MHNNIVVVGAGVSGLTTALLLSKNKANRITVVAKHMPGDYDIEYASPFAGANYLPMATEENSRWERRTWVEIKRLCDQVPEAGIHYQKCWLYRRKKDLEVNSQGSFSDALYQPDPWIKDLFDDYRELESEEVPAAYDSGCVFTSVCINTAIYLPWLLGQCVRNNVVLKRGILNNICEAKGLSHTGQPANIIINATGLGSFNLGGVEDKTMAPARGQIVLIRNESDSMLDASGTDDGETEHLYLMPRAVGGGTILGGTYDIGNWDPTPDPEIGARIMQRIVTARPEIAMGKGVEGLSVVRHAVGLRPWRKGGLRLEAEEVDEDSWIVHNYGHSGWGYQGSYGCAEGVVELVDNIGKGVLPHL